MNKKIRNNKNANKRPFWSHKESVFHRVSLNEVLRSPFVQYTDGGLFDKIRNRDDSDRFFTTDRRFVVWVLVRGWEVNEYLHRAITEYLLIFWNHLYYINLYGLLLLYIDYSYGIKIIQGENHLYESVQFDCIHIQSVFG